MALCASLGERFVCSAPGCGRTFKYRSRLTAHEQAHTPAQDRPFACDEDGCNQRFNSAQHRDAHRAAKHDTTTAVRYKCRLCGVGFRKNKLRQDHMTAEHGGQKPYVCAFAGCTSSFSLPSARKKHVARVHASKTKRFLCSHEACSSAFETHADLLRHNRTDHKPVCLSCGRIFQTKQQLADHEPLHERPLESRKTFPCPHANCQKRYTREYALRTHIAVKHDNARLHACMQCDARFAHKVSLQRHTERRHTSRPQQPVANLRQERSLLDQIVGAPLSARCQAADGRWSRSDPPSGNLTLAS